jgi:hypothetical protein
VNYAHGSLANANPKRIVFPSRTKQKTVVFEKNNLSFSDETFRPLFRRLSPMGYSGELPENSGELRESA